MTRSQKFVTSLNPTSAGPSRTVVIEGDIKGCLDAVS